MIMHNNARILLTVGLVVTAVAFAMLDRGWLKDVFGAIGPIKHPLAAGVGLVGLVFVLTGARMLRRSSRAMGAGDSISHDDENAGSSR